MDKLKQALRRFAAQKWRVALAIVVALLLVWLALATPLLVGIANRDKSFRRVEDAPYGGEYRVAGALDSFSVEPGVMQTVRLFGWVYCMSPAGDDETVAHVLAVGDKASYKLTPARSFRDDLYKVFTSDTVGQKRFAGINGEFSPLGMKDGTYRLHWQVEENGRLAGTEASDYFLKKAGGSVEVYRWASERHEPVEPETETGVLSEISWVGPGDREAFEVTGWAFMEGEIAGQSIWLQVRDEAGNTARYSTLKERNAYVASSVLGEAYAKTAFTAELLGLETKPVELSVLVEKDGVFYKGTSVQIDYDESRGDNPWGFAGVAPHAAAEPAEAAPDAAADSLLYNAVDQIDKNENGNYDFYGWAFRPDTEIEALTLEVTDEAGEVTAWTSESYTRPDLALSNGMAYANSGFRCLDVPVAAPASLRLVARLADGSHLATPAYTLRLTGEGAGATVLAQPAGSAAEAAEGGVEAGIDRAERGEDGRFTVVGWAFRTGGDALADEAFVVLQNEDGSETVYTTQRRRRDDVALAGKNDALANSGFEAVIEGHEGKVASVRVLVKGPGGAALSAAVEVAAG